MERKLQYSILTPIALLLTSVVVVFSIHALSRTAAVNLDLFFGSVPPILATLITCIAGFVAFYSLSMHLHLPILEPRSFRRGFPLAVVLAVPFMIVVTITDIAAPFPADINVTVPTALAYYPVMGFIAQVALHVVPFALLIVIGEVFLGMFKRTSRLWLSLILASALEPVFQVMSSTGDGRPLLATAAMAISLFLFGLVELQLYRRFDYTTMFVFRMLYYIYWHLVWGSLRLHLLF